ncbi:MAG: TIGR00153 family protein [Thiolinea sp.]
MVAKSYMASLFGRSPFSPLQEHMSRVHAGVEHLVPLVEGMIAADIDQVVASREKIVQAEHDADDMKRELRHHLPKGFFMPVDRRDLLDVLTRQDQIVNQAKDIAGLAMGRKMVIPEQMQEQFRVYTARCVASVTQALDIINTLDELVEIGFRGLEAERVERMLQELDSIENETDELQVELRAVLFTLEDELRPTDVMFTYRMIEWMGHVADDAQKVGSRLQLMLAR